MTQKKDIPILISLPLRWDGRSMLVCSRCKHWYEFTEAKKDGYCQTLMMKMTNRACTLAPCGGRIVVFAQEEGWVPPARQ